jgi:DNA polymerase-1
MNVHVIASAADIPLKKIEIDGRGILGFDIETEPKLKYRRSKTDVPPDPRLTNVVLAQVAVGDDDVYVLKDNFGSLKQLLQDKNVTKVIHNATFERKHMLSSYGIVINNVADTMLIEGVYENGRKVSLHLDDVCNRHLGIKLDKTVRKRFIRGDSIDDEMVKYAAEDAWVLPKLFQQYKVETLGRNYPKSNTVLGLEHKLNRVVVQMELEGFGINYDKWKVVADKVEKKLVAVRSALIKELPLPTRRVSIDGNIEGQLNLNSGDKVVELLQTAGVDINDLKKNTVADLLAKKKYAGNKLLRLYQAYSLLEKASSTYGYGFLNHVNPVTHRIHSNYKQVGTRTGRFSGDNPNTMNIPKEAKYRGSFCAGPGNVLVAADYSQQELAILAEICGDKRMIDAFERGVDFHNYAAELLFGDITKRKPAKSLNFGLLYGLGARGLAKTLGCSVSEATELMQLHAHTFSGAFEWTADTIAFAQTHGYVDTLLGRRRYLDPIDFAGQARNTPIQGTAADMTKLALIIMYKAGLHPVNVVHDEAVVECKAEEGPETLIQVQACMSKASKTLLKKVPLRTDGYVNTVWLNPKDEKRM